MASMSELGIGRRVAACVDGQQREGTIVGRRINNRIEGYLAPPDSLRPPSEQGPDMVQVSFPMRSTINEWVTTGLTCLPDRVELVR